MGSILKKVKMPVKVLTTLMSDNIYYVSFLYTVKTVSYIKHIIIVKAKTIFVK